MSLGAIWRGVVERDFSVKYGAALPEKNPSLTASHFWVQTSWPDSVKYNTNHIIVVKRTP